MYTKVYEWSVLYIHRFFKFTVPQVRLIVNVGFYPGYHRGLCLGILKFRELFYLFFFFYKIIVDGEYKGFRLHSSEYRAKNYVLHISLGRMYVLLTPRVRVCVCTPPVCQAVAS